MDELPKIVAIVGPTGSGKTAWSLSLAREFGGEVLSADSRLIYKELNIGTAKPVGARVVPGAETISELFGERPFLVEGIKHWGIDIIEASDDYSVSDYASYARERIEDMDGRGVLPLVVGGTGLYISAIIDNPTYTKVEPNEKLRAELATLSVEELRERLRDLDLLALDIIDIDNPRRLIRAIEVVTATGKRWGEQQVKGAPWVNALQIGIEVEKEALYDRLNHRVDAMVAAGLVTEVRMLYEKFGGECTAMTGIGYRQIVSFLKGECELREAIEQIKVDTRHYAKRQLTWFKRDPRIVWVKSLDEARALVDKFLNH